jgi:hypothetical protein
MTGSALHSPEKVPDLESFLKGLEERVSGIVGRLHGLPRDATLVVGAYRMRDDIEAAIKTVDAAVRDAVGDYEDKTERPIKRPSLHSPDLNKAGEVGYEAAKAMAAKRKKPVKKR